MRTLPKTLNDFRYMVSKVGLSPFRGILLWVFFCKGSRLPFLGRGVKILVKSKVTFGRHVWIGSNSFIDASSESGIKFSDGVTIRENSTIQCRSGLSKVGQGLLIGVNTFIGPCCKIGVGGFITIGENCQIGAHCCFNAESHVLKNGSFTSGKTKRLGIFVGDNVWMGDGVTVLDGVTIGDSAVIGAGSVVNRSVPAREIYAGVPAKKL